MSAVRRTSPASPADPAHLDPPVVDTARLGAALADLVRVTRRDATLPLGASTLSALRTVAEHGPLRAGDLARHEGVAAPTLSRIVAGLDADGYVLRTPDPDDRRVAWLEVTACGRDLLDEVRARRARALATRAARLTADQAATLQAALDALESLTRD